jgi:hypothetical protein
MNTPCTDVVLCANDFPGDDLGAQINAADLALGDRGGEIWACGGTADAPALIRTTIIVSSNHTLRLFPGYYQHTTAYVKHVSGPAIMLKSNSRLIGSGWGTVIRESTHPENWTVIAAHDGFTSADPEFEAVDENLEIKDLQIQGAQPTLNSALSAIWLGNVHGAVVENVFFNGTHGIGLTVGGFSTSQHNYADSVWIRNCRLLHVATQGLAVVNGQNIHLVNNLIQDMGQPSSPLLTAIDGEANADTDLMKNIHISGNIIDLRGNPERVLANAIQVKSFVIENGGPIEISNNLIIGNEVEVKLSNGITVAGVQDATLVGNAIRSATQTGIMLSRCRRAVVLNNSLMDVGIGGSPPVPAVLVDGTTDSKFLGNVFGRTGERTFSNLMKEDPPADGNLFTGNLNFQFELSGASSRAINNVP